MTTKRLQKGRRKGKAKGDERSIEERARAIIDSPDRYGEEARHAINSLLREESPYLAEFVTRAERGEEVFDLVHPLPGKADSHDPRAVARQLIERSRRLLHETLNYRPITFKEAGELADKIIKQDDDVRAWAFITLLHGLAAAYFERKKAEHNGTSYREPDVESLVFAATRNAYGKTSHFTDSQREFTELPPGTVEAMNDDELRKEAWSAKGASNER